MCENLPHPAVPASRDAGTAAPHAASLTGGDRGEGFLAHSSMRFYSKPTFGRPVSRPKSSLCLLNNTRECCCVCYGHIRQDLPVQNNVGLLQPFHEAIVRKPVASRTSADPCDPEAAKIPLSCPTIAVRVAKSPFQCLFSLFQCSTAATNISLGRLHDLVSSGPAGRCTSCSGHH